MDSSVSRSVIVGLCLAFAGCLGAAAAQNYEGLRAAAQQHNELLRWKKFDQAAAFLPPEEQAAFVSRYLAAEADLSVHGVEIRAVSQLPGELRPAAEVVVLADVSRLPSTVVQKIVMTQRWERYEGRWLMVRSDREIVPPLDLTAPPTPQPPWSAQQEAGAPQD